MLKDNCIPGCENHRYGQLSGSENSQLQNTDFPMHERSFVKEKLVNKQKTDVPKSKGAIRSRILSLLDVKEMKPGISTICVITFHSETNILGTVA